MLPFTIGLILLAMLAFALPCIVTGRLLAWLLYGRPKHPPDDPENP